MNIVVWEGLLVIDVLDVRVYGVNVTVLRDVEPESFITNS